MKRESRPGIKIEIDGDSLSDILDSLEAYHEREIAVHKEEVKARDEALKQTLESLAPAIPLLISYLMPKSSQPVAEIAKDPMIESLIRSFNPDQLQKLTELLSPTQLAMLMEIVRHYTPLQDEESPPPAPETASEG